MDITFKPGERVRIKRTSRYYGTDRFTNPADKVGVIVNIYSPQNLHRIEVEWSQGYTNSYRPEDLELAREKSKLLWD